jgi:hypothetical protein
MIDDYKEIVYNSDWLYNAKMITASSPANHTGINN